jgi:hypothetical protein
VDRTDSSISSSNFTSPTTALWADLGSPDMTSPGVQKKIIDGVLEEVGEPGQSPQAQLMNELP